MLNVVIIGASGRVGTTHGSATVREDLGKRRGDKSDILVGTEFTVEHAVHAPIVSLRQEARDTFDIELHVRVAHANVARSDTHGSNLGGSRDTVGELLGILATTCIWRVLAGTLIVSDLWSPAFPRLLWVAVAIIIFPMITMLLALQTSQRLQEEINEQARRDVLTGAFNRRAFEEHATREWTLAERQGLPLSMLAVDIDHFKSINDRYGHQTGDATLTQVSCAAQTSLRASDIWCRYGGEEFVALLPNTTLEQAKAIAERLRAAVETAVITTSTGTISVTVSIGVAEGAPPQGHWTNVLAISDAALYEAKAKGRNQVVAGEASRPS